MFITNISRRKHKGAHSCHRRPSWRGIELGRQLDMRENPHLTHILLVHSLPFKPIDNKTKQRICISFHYSTPKLQPQPTQRSSPSAPVLTLGRTSLKTPAWIHTSYHFPAKNKRGEGCTALPYGGGAPLGCRRPSRSPRA